MHRLLLIAFLCCACLARAQDAPVLDVPGGYPTHTPVPSPLPPSPHIDSSAKGIIPTADATPSMKQLAQHADKVQQEGEKGVWHTGLFAELGDAPAFDWLPQADGSTVGVLRVVSAGAEGIRIEFSQLLLPAGAYVIVYSEFPVAGSPEPATIFGPYNAIPPASLSFWTPTLPGDSAIIEVLLPPGASSADAHVGIKRVVHRIVNMEKILAGACNLDATCHPAWAVTASSVGGLGVIGDDGELFCTCTLLNDTDPCTDTPLVLTANHCVRGQTGVRGADSLEFYFEFDTPTCNGVPPSPLVVTRYGGGADYLAGSGGRGDTGGGNDFTLLRMRQIPHVNLYRAGYTTALPGIGTLVTCVHHPRGEYKRISFGALTATDNPFASLYHEVTWSQGTTEPGSSGSPLFLGSTQQIIGQLWGGGASCSQLLEPDYYGRFNVSAASIGTYLDPDRSVTFAMAEFSAIEGGTAQVVLQLARPAPGSGASVDCTITPQTAQPGFDYADTSARVHFLEGETTAIFAIPLLDTDSRFELDEFALLTLSNPNHCIELGPTTTATLRIIDNDPDSDGDAISDADELSGALGHITDPNVADSDGDGINDRSEQTSYSTNPNDPDTDGDSMRDGTEIAFGTDPLVPNPNELPTIRLPLFRE